MIIGLVISFFGLVLIIGGFIALFYEEHRKNGLKLILIALAIILIGLSVCSVVSR